MSLLTVRDLDAGYGDLQILSGVELTVTDGEYVTIVGPNGAGKSTVIKTIIGLATYHSGTIEYQETDIANKSPEATVRSGVGYVPQTENIFPGLTVEENLRLGAYPIEGVPAERLDFVYDRFPVLRDRQGQQAGALSGGQQQMLAMGAALMPDPELLLLDEPSAGLAPDLVDEMFDHIDGINETGTTILMVEQNAKEALARSDRGYVLVNGENRYSDDSDALLHDDEVRRQFLGGG